MFTTSTRRFFVSLPNTVGVGGQGQGINLTILTSHNLATFPNDRIFVIAEEDKPKFQAPTWGGHIQGGDPGMFVFVADALHVVRRMFYPSADCAVVVGMCEGRVYFKNDGSLPTALIGRTMQTDMNLMRRLSNIATMELNGYTFYPRTAIPLPMMDDGFRHRALSIMTVESDPRGDVINNCTSLVAGGEPKFNTSITFGRDMPFTPKVDLHISVFTVNGADGATPRSIGLFVAHDAQSGKLAYLDIPQSMVVDLIHRTAHEMVKKGIQEAEVIGLVNFSYVQSDKDETYITYANTRLEIFGNIEMPSRHSVEGFDPGNTRADNHMNVPSDILRANNYGELDSTVHPSRREIPHNGPWAPTRALAMTARVDRNEGTDRSAARIRRTLVLTSPEIVPAVHGRKYIQTLTEAHLAFEQMFKNSSSETKEAIAQALSELLSGSGEPTPVMYARFGNRNVQLIVCEALWSRNLDRTHIDAISGIRILQDEFASGDNPIKVAFDKFYNSVDTDTQIQINSAITTLAESGITDELNTAFTQSELSIIIGEVERRALESMPVNEPADEKPLEQRLPDTTDAYGLKEILRNGEDPSLP